MVLAATLHESRTGRGVYLFAADFPDYNRRMEAIAFLTRMWMQWDDGLRLV